MKLPSMKKVKDIATKVREAMELFAPTIEHEVHGNTEDLCCYCAIAAHALHTAYKRAGIQSKLIIGFFDENDDWDYNDESSTKLEANHCWVEVAYHYVDITATQYGMYYNKKVVVIDSSVESPYYPYEKPKTIKSMQGKGDKSWGEQAPRIQYTNQILKLAGLTK